MAFECHGQQPCPYEVIEGNELYLFMNQASHTYSYCWCHMPDIAAVDIIINASIMTQWGLSLEPDPSLFLQGLLPLIPNQKLDKQMFFIKGG